MIVSGQCDKVTIRIINSSDKVNVSIDRIHWLANKTNHFICSFN